MLAFKSQSGHWLGPVTLPGLLGPAQPHGSGGPNQKKQKNSSKSISKKFVIFL